ncbi:uncharacterized protein LOC128959074 [Oppia nitens]|uniref:uncharacterized protein LOC128959074 n=1 Tax=Oppia nitens TaxID=1686743 RepID=UPI0023D9C48C|nr:uncharacterized protein LOC128959074 [Oppia nitens]
MIVNHNNDNHKDIQKDNNKMSNKLFILITVVVIGLLTTTSYLWLNIFGLNISTVITTDYNNNGHNRLAAANQTTLVDAIANTTTATGVSQNISTTTSRTDIADTGLRAPVDGLHQWIKHFINNIPIGRYKPRPTGTDSSSTTRAGNNQPKLPSLPLPTTVVNNNTISQPIISQNGRLLRNNSPQNTGSEPLANSVGSSGGGGGGVGDNRQQQQETVGSNDDSLQPIGITREKEEWDQWLQPSKGEPKPTINDPIVDNQLTTPLPVFPSSRGEPKSKHL